MEIRLGLAELVEPRIEGAEPRLLGGNAVAVEDCGPSGPDRCRSRPVSARSSGCIGVLGHVMT